MDTIYRSQVKRPKRTVKTIVVFAAIIALIISISIAFIVYTWNVSMEYTESEAIQLAEIAEAGISKSLVGKLLTDIYDGNSNEYREIKQELISIAHLENNIRFSYLLAYRDDKIHVLADSEPVGSSDYSPPGQVYAEASEEYFLTFYNEETVLTKPITDRWGKWISVLVPMKNPESEEIIAVFGVDYPAETWKTHAIIRTMQAVFVVLCVYILFAALYYAFSKNSELVNEKKKLVISEMRLKESEQLFRTVFEQANIGIAICNNDKFVTLEFSNQPGINPMYEKIAGRNKEELERIGWTAITHPEDVEKDKSKYEEIKAGRLHSYEMEKRYIRPDGSIVWVNIIISPLKLESNLEFYHLCLIEDISRRKAIEKALKESEQSKAVLLDNLPGMAYRCNNDRDWTMQFVSKGCFTLTGYNAESLINNRELSFNDIIAPKYRDYLWEKWVQLLKEGSRLKEEYELITASGEVKWVLEQGQGIYDENGNVIALEGLIIDITERKKQEMKLKYISEHDILTGLFNRRYFEEIISGENGFVNKRAVLLLNIRNFSHINVAHGYTFGEAFIRDLAQRLQVLCTENCSLFHISIDRFAYYINSCEDESVLIDLCEDILAIVDAPTISGLIRGSIGIYKIEGVNENADNALKFAAIAAEQASKNLTNSYCYFDRVMEEAIIRKEIITSELAEAAADESDGRLYLEYQPIVYARTHKIYGFEALARFRSEKLGIVSPAEFIPLAEETQLIVPLGRRIMNIAFRFLKNLECKGYTDIKTSINVSAIQLLSKEFLSGMSNIINRTGVTPSNLIIEITESVFSNDYQEINKRLYSIRETGIGTSIDDFGTGYSSLARERELNISCIKIDKSFIDKLVEHETDREITGDIISMAHKLGQAVVAEGVEHERQKRYLVENGCDFIQGYLYSKPLAEDKALELLEKSSRAENPLL